MVVAAEWSGLIQTGEINFITGFGSSSCNCCNDVDDSSDLGLHACLNSSLRKVNEFGEYCTPFMILSVTCAIVSLTLF